MRRTLAWIAIVVTALLLQSTVFSQIKLGGAKPELMYLVTVVLAMLEGPASGAIGGFSAGMAQDFLLNDPKGITALVLTVLGYAVGTVRQFITTPSPALPTILVGAGTAVGVLFYGFVAFLLGRLPGDVLFLLRVAVLSAVYNAILTPLAYPLLRRVAETTRAKKVHRW
ncbi:MAG TPA: rod shape-determining protein MreD [Actinomycetota bacterium]|nr:rod shape-determining protein MreD [Actinomycetota bacterium]